MKTVNLDEAQGRLNELFETAQAGSPVFLIRGGQVVKLERVEPPEFGGDSQRLESMLLDAVRSAHTDWTPKDLENIERRVRARRGE